MGGVKKKEESRIGIHNHKEEGGRRSFWFGEIVRKIYDVAGGEKKITTKGGGGGRQSKLESKKKKRGRVNGCSLIQHQKRYPL